ncbi:MAG TPA: Sjogren's syndrome/scleroderma autoantigen 1 family protein [Methanomicrobiales archaeon]|nr:Sjogren's syndrome/scleroderma autoantigen 1 family protein [Methanomicrobiales archaeon]
MEKKKPDDIMAECLLRGGKMLSKACRACGSPLFEVKGETLCVVCRETGKEAGKVKTPRAVSKGAAAGVAGGRVPGTTGTHAPAGETGADPVAELRQTVAELARKARVEKDPKKVAALLEAAKRGAEALALLQR